jgi:hypothetical protein
MRIAHVSPYDHQVSGGVREHVVNLARQHAPPLGQILQAEDVESRTIGRRRRIEGDARADVRDLPGQRLGIRERAVSRPVDPELLAGLRAAVEAVPELLGYLGRAVRAGGGAVGFSPSSGSS